MMPPMISDTPASSTMLIRGMSSPPRRAPQKNITAQIRATQNRNSRAGSWALTSV
jgi:hypothetical protein